MIRYDHLGNKKESKSYICKDEVNHDEYYFEIYDDSLVEVKEIELGDDILKHVWVAVVVDGESFLMHRRKFEAGRPWLRKNVEDLAETLKDIRHSFMDTTLPSVVDHGGEG